MDKPLQSGLFVDGGPASLPPFADTLLGLGTVKGLGYKGLRGLTSQLDGRLESIWRLTPSETQNILSAVRVPGALKIAESIHLQSEEILRTGAAKAKSLGHMGVTLLRGAELPPGLSQAPAAPQWLFVEGDPSALFAKPYAAVVGTREASRRGRMATQTIVKLLAAYPIALISGLAQGIDAEAHLMALEYDVRNIAFLGTGIDVVFPRDTADLRRRIVEQAGAVATEYLPGDAYGREKFIERNRLQAALADVVVPIEARQRSGTAHTVRFAREMRRPIIGLRWNGSPEMINDLTQGEAMIVDIFTSEAWRSLDKYFRGLAEACGHRTNALHLVERRLLRESSSRALRRRDIESLARVLDSLAVEDES